MRHRNVWKRLARFRPYLLGMAFASLVQAPSLLAAQTCQIPHQLRTAPPIAEGEEPLQVRVGLYVLDLIAIDDVAQTFTADLFFSLEWRDHRLSSAELGTSLQGCRLSLSDIWHPYVDILNRRGSSLGPLQPLDVDDQGVVLFRHRVQSDLAAQLELRDYPFDRQLLGVDVGSFRYGPNEVSLVRSEERSGILPNVVLEGWRLGETTNRSSSEFVASQNRELSKLELRMALQRRSAYHFWKVLLPLSLIVLMAWSAFWFDPQQLPPQVSVATASVFTLIAFQLSLGYMLPRLEYLTRIDRFVLGSTTLVFLGLGVVIWKSQLVRAERVDAARSVDRWARWIYLMLFAGVWLITIPL